MASGSEHDDEAPSLASRVLDLLDDDLLGLGEIPTEAAPEPPHDAPALGDAQAPEEPQPAVADTPQPEASPQVTDQSMEVATEHDEVEEEAEAEPVEQHPSADDEAQDIAGETMDEPVAPAPSESRRGRKFKPKGMFRRTKAFVY